MRGVKGAVLLEELFEVINNRPEALVLESSFGPVNVVPASEFFIPVDSATVLSNGTVKPEEREYMVKNIHWQIKDRAITKSQIVALDIIAHNNWERPVYFSATAGSDAYLGLNDFLRNEGFALRLVPVSAEIEEGFDGFINSDVLYNKLMNVYSYGNMQDPDVYIDETNLRMINNLRTLFGRLSSALAEEGRSEEAVKVADKCLTVIPETSVPYNYFMLPVAQSYLAAGAKEKGAALLTSIFNLYKDELDYYFSFPSQRLPAMHQDIRHAIMVINGVVSISEEQGLDDLKDKASKELDKQIGRYDAAGFR